MKDVIPICPTNIPNRPPPLQISPHDPIQVQYTKRIIYALLNSHSSIPWSHFPNITNFLLPIWDGFFFDHFAWRCAFRLPYYMTLDPTNPPPPTIPTLFISFARSCSATCSARARTRWRRRRTWGHPPTHFRYYCPSHQGPSGCQTAAETKSAKGRGCHDKNHT